MPRGSSPPVASTSVRLAEALADRFARSIADAAVDTFLRAYATDWTTVMVAIT